MDPVLLSLWWAVPGAVGAVAVSWWGVRSAHVKGAHRLAYDAATIDVARSRSALTRARTEVSATKAELMHTQAAREAGRASSADVSSARRRMGIAQQHARAASSALRAARAGRSAAKRELRTRVPGAPTPLDHTVAEHEAIETRWLDYETDPALALAFPALLDGSAPATATFLEARRQAHWLRPPREAKRVTAEQYVVYRDAVRHMRIAFEQAERSARAGAGAPLGGDGSRPRGLGDRLETAEDWVETAREVFARSGEALGRASDQLGRLTDAWRRRSDHRRHDRDSRSGGGDRPQ